MFLFGFELLALENSTPNLSSAVCAENVGLLIGSEGRECRAREDQLGPLPLVLEKLDAVGSGGAPARFDDVQGYIGFFVIQA